MELLVIALSVLLLVLLSYLFFVKRELRRIRKEIDFILKENTNGVVHTESSMKEMVDLVNSINQQLRLVKQKESMIEHKNHNFMKMIRNISHDLRTPLTSASGYVDLSLKQQMTLEETVKNLKVVEERLHRLSELIDAFFEFSKVTSNSGNIKLNSTNLVALLEKSISNHYEDFSNQNRVIHLKVKEKQIELISNDMMLLRVFDNLIRNAYNHSTSDLTIEAECKDEIVLRFMNSIDVPELDVTHMFDEFYTMDISRTKGNTGLGLAIAKEFVEQLGGTICAQKRKDKLTITVCLPVHRFPAKESCHL